MVQSPGEIFYFGVSSLFVILTCFNTFFVNNNESKISGIRSNFQKYFKSWIIKFFLSNFAYKKNSSFFFLFYFFF